MDIVLTGNFDEGQLSEVAAAAPAARIVFCSDAAAISREIVSAEIVAGEVSAADLAAARNLKWVHSWAAGPDKQLFSEFAVHPATLTCSKGSGAVPLAERAMMLMLMLQHQARRSFAAQGEQKWDFFFHGELAEKTVGIIGAGHCGLDLALKAKAFHMRVLGLRRGTVTTPNFDRMYRRDQLHDFLASCDFVVVTAPRTVETEGLLDAAALAAMKPGAFYVCVSRGGIADDAALLSALRSGMLAGAGLDAHTIEPLPVDSPFWSEPNVFVMAHNGATTPESRVRRYQIFLDNLKRYNAGEPLRNVVNKVLGY